MYLCQITNKFSKPGEKLNKVVIETRSVQYKNWDREAEEEWFSYGNEIVKEINASDAGRELWDSWSEEDRKLFVASFKK
jgi:hypothetical protein